MLIIELNNIDYKILNEEFKIPLDIINSKIIKKTIYDKNQYYLLSFKEDSFFLFNLSNKLYINVNKDAHLYYPENELLAYNNLIITDDIISFFQSSKANLYFKNKSYKILFTPIFNKNVLKKVKYINPSSIKVFTFYTDIKNKELLKTTTNFVFNDLNYTINISEEKYIIRLNNREKEYDKIIYSKIRNDFNIKGIIKNLS